MDTSHLIRLTVGLDRHDMPTFIPGAKLIQSKQAASTGTFTALPVPPATLLSQIGDVETVHIQSKTTKGLIPLRTSRVNILWNSFESNCTYCEGLCQQQTPETGLAWAEASGFHVVLVGQHARDLITVKVDLGLGVAHLSANKALFPSPSGRKSAAVTWLWRHTVDGGKTIVNDDSTPTHVSTITGLPVGVEVGFSAAVKDSKAVGPWSHWVPVLIR